MAVVRNADGSLGIQSADGLVLPWHLGESRLKDMGLSVPPPITAGLTDASRGALAEYGPPPPPPDYSDAAARSALLERSIAKARAAGKAPPARTDATAAMSPAAPEEPDFYGKVDAKLAAIPSAAARAADAVGYGNFVPPSVSREAPASTAAPAAQATPEGKATLRNGGKVVPEPGGSGQPGSQPQGGGGPRPHLIKGGDVRVGYNVTRTNANPADMQAAEDAEADASIDEKLAAQKLSDSSAYRSASMAQRLGEQLDAEDTAVARQAQKNQAIEAEYNRRQGQIDQEREAIDTMPIQGAKEILGDRDAFSKFISAISIIAGGAAQGMGATKENVGLQIRDQAVNQALRAQQAKRDARLQGMQIQETQLERLQKQYGNPEAAEAELRDRLDTLFQKHAYQMTLDSGATDAAANLQAQFAQKDAERAKSRLARQEALAGSITEHVQNLPDRYVGPAAPKEADIHQLSADEEKAGIGAEAADLGRTIDVIHSMPEGDIPTVGSRHVLSRVGRSFADFVAGQGTAGKVFDTPSEHAAATKVEQIRGQLRHQLSGAAVSPTEAPILERQLQDLNTKEGLLNFATDLQRKIQRHQSGIRAGSRPEVVQEYERRKTAYGVRTGPSSARGE